MIENNVEILPRTIVRHDEGLLYRVDAIHRNNTIDYEATRALAGKLIDYTQLEDGEYPAGTQYGKDEVGFRRHFTIVNVPTKSAVLEVLDEIRGL